MYKDIFNPFRKPTKEEMNKLQTMVDDIYSHFVNLVSINRKIEKNIITDDIGAMVFNSKRAKLNYLIDDEKNINVTKIIIYGNIPIGKRILVNR